MFEHLKKLVGVAVKQEHNEQKTSEVPAPYTPSIQSITNKGIVVYWKKPQGVSGYEIYRSYTEGELGELAKIIDDPILGVWSDTEFDASKRAIYYTVRSFLIEKDDTKRVSEFTEQFAANFIEKLKLERDVTILHSGMSRKIKALYGWGEPDGVAWSSSDETIATVDKDGIITGISKGKCTIICKSSELDMVASSMTIIDREAPEPLTVITSRYEYDDATGIYKNCNEDKDNEATIMMVGDMMCGIGQIQKQYSEEEGWNFNDSFEFIRTVTSDADFVIGNLETLLDPAWPYMSDEWFINNISNCNAPARYLDAIKYGGFDGVVMSNNHSCDGGLVPLISTITQVDKYKLVRTGAYKSENERRYAIVEINGIKVGYVAYMSTETGYNGKDRGWTDTEKDVHLSNFDYCRARKEIEECRSQGAEYVIAYMHWGQKNYKIPTDVQEKEAQQIANAGADYIIGSNPHVLERYDIVTTDDGRSVPCFYSVGNFHARMNQIKGNRDSVIVRITLKRENGNVILVENNYIPCFTYSSLDGCYLPPVSLIKNQNAGVARKGRETKYKRIQDAIGNKIEVYNTEV